MSLLVDVDTWITEYDSCRRLCGDIQIQIATRNTKLPLSTEYSHISATIRIRLLQLKSELEQLQQKLKQSSHNNNKLTLDEAERRYRQIETLQSKQIQLERAYTSMNNDVNKSRSDLMQQSKNSRLWETDDDDDEIARFESTKPTTSNKRPTSEILQEQNEQLESLSHLITRQKDIAIKIGDEVDVQNDILDDLGFGLGQTDTRMNSETQHIGLLIKKDSTWGYWIVIIILFISICIVSVL